ncbi:MAG TPA: MFS transporter [Candidatus Acidoferrales bacterium]|nr:MFS transporter [Candidatus Acidoferrales bacterium]
MRRAFLAYFVARESTWFAEAIANTAIAWQIYAIRHQALDLALVGLVAFIPQLLLAIPAGLIADRLDRRAVVIVMGAGALAGSLLFLMLALQRSHSVAAYLGVLLLYSVADALSVPALRAMLPSLVHGAQYLRATAMISAVSEFGAIAGPAIAGMLIAIAPWLAFGIAAILQLATIAAFFFVGSHARSAPPEESLWASAIGGFRYMLDRKIILGAISLDLFAVLFGGATALLPIYATQILHVGATGYGFLRAAPSLGAALVGIWLVRRPIHRNGARWLFWCIAGFGLSTIVFGFSHNMALSLLALTGTGGFDMVSVVIRNALAQLGTPEAMRGRVGAFENVFIGASNQLGTFESGMVAQWFGPVVSVVFGGFATIVVVALWTRIFPDLRRFDRLEELR